MTTATMNHETLLDRSAIRFLLAHRQGRLVTGSPVTGETWVSAVEYSFGADGSLVLELPDDGEHTKAIRQGGPTALTVVADPQALTGPIIDEDGLPTPSAIAHLSARVDANVDARRAKESISVRLYVRDVEVYLRREPAMA